MKRARDRYIVSLEYRADLVGPETARDLVTSFRDWMRAAVLAPDHPMRARPSGPS